MGKEGENSASPLNDDITYSMLSGSIRTWEIRPTRCRDNRPDRYPVRAGAEGIKTPKNQDAVGSLALARSGAHACIGSSGHGGHTKKAKPVTPHLPARLNMSFNGDLFKFHFIAEKNADYG